MATRRVPLSVLAIVAAATASILAQAPPSPADLAARIQTRYSTVRDFTADFTLTNSGGLTRQSAQERGKAWVKKPGRMRWIFETGSKHELVSDGTKIYSYLPKDAIVDIADFPKPDQASPALLLLAGRGDLTRDFIPIAPVEAPPGEWRLTVKPKTPQGDFATLTLVVDRTALRLRGLVVRDAQGGVQQFQFVNLKENQGVADSAFEFKIPKGVEVRKR